MRILYHHRTLADGAEGIHIREMIRAFRQLGHEVEIVALAGENEASNQETQGQRRWSWVSRLMPESVYELAELGYNVIGSRSVSRAIREFQPDFIYDRYNSYCTAATATANHHGIPVVLEVNAPVAFERSQYDEKMPLKFPSMAVSYEKKICAQADHVFTVSTPLRDFLVSDREVPTEKLTVLPNGANPEQFDPSLKADALKAKLGLVDRFVLGFVGILRPWHGVEMLVNAFARLRRDRPDLHLLLVGDGPSEDALKSQCDQLGIADHVTFTGRVSHAEICEYIASMNVAVSPRATFYASPMKILEYMAMGVPTVAPDMPNIRDILTHGSEGWLFEPESESSLENALKEVVADDKRCERLAASARLRVENDLNWSQNAKTVIGTVEELFASEQLAAVS
ncbi:MAG: glycosyltransferase family 4 protein [Pirellulaceae bacterium]|nr:glycosyltransferase family 4 protein [Pirellulaceae bacterium]